MLKTLAWRNVKRSVGDYRIYFLTLSVSVCLFYLFYSLKDQQKLIELSVIQQNMLDYTFQALQLVSLVVLAILGLLIIYANHFLLQRRKQEFGLYLTMGMGYRKVLTILWLETVLIAGFALGFGLIAGVLGSQVMTFITAELFDAPLKAYQFIISWRTIGSTIVYFSVMFTCVVAFNGLWLTRYQLRDLFTARQRSQMKEPMRISRKIGVLLMGSGLIMTGYTLIFVTKLISNLVVTSIGVSLIVIGTLAIIMMGIPVGLHICQQRKQRYYRGTNSVFIRNMAHQMQTNVLALSVISLLLFATMTTLALGFSYKQAVESNLNEIAPFDGSISLYYSRFESDELPNIRSVLAESKVDINDYGMTETLVEYGTDVTKNQFFNNYQQANPTLQTFFDHGAIVKIPAISWSDYQRLMAIQGKQAEPLQADEVLMLSNIREMEVVLAQQVTQQKRVEISEQTYRMKAYAMETIENENYGRNLVTFVVPDEAVIDLRPQRSIINVFFKKENEAILNQEFQDLALEMQMNPNRFENEIGYFQAISQSEVYQETSGQTTLLIYVGIYVGLVSLLASATILAIQQLMAVAVNREQYVILSHLGVGWEAQRKLIRQQVSFYFLMPLAVAGIHSMITIVLVIRNVAEMNFASVLHPLIITAIVFGFVYGGYGYATYSSYCQIVNEKK